MTDDIDEARDWLGNEIDCASCTHQALQPAGVSPAQSCCQSESPDVPNP